MRVMLVCPYSLTRPGGVQGQVLGLARALRGIGVEARVLAPCDGPPPEPGVVSVGPSVEWETNGSIAPIAPGKTAADRAVSALRSADPDVVHLHEPLVPGPTLTALLGFAGPMVGTFHIAGEMPHAYLKPAMKRLVGRLGARVAVSEAARDLARQIYGGEFSVLWNGIDAGRYAAVEPWPSPRPAVLFVGRHEPRKGLGVLLEAWRGIDRDAVLWVVGRGPETDSLHRRRVGAVEWLGPLDDRDLARRLRGATAFAAPALGGESFGLVLLEAMAAGAPVVASGITGYANVARADREAVLVAPGDTDALRDGLRRVLDDPALRARLVAAGAARAEEFSMVRLARAYAALYEEVAASRETRRRVARPVRLIRSRDRAPADPMMETPSTRRLP